MQSKFHQKGQRNGVDVKYTKFMVWLKKHTDTIAPAATINRTLKLHEKLKKKKRITKRMHSLKIYNKRWYAYQRP